MGKDATESHFIEKGGNYSASIMQARSGENDHEDGEAHVAKVHEPRY